MESNICILIVAMLFMVVLMTCLNAKVTFINKFYSAIISQSLLILHILRLLNSKKLIR